MIGVVIGDSIATGIVEWNSRLYTYPTKKYTPNYPNHSGQISGELSRLFGFFWYNQGIGGDNTTGVWNRWQRDVLGQVYDPGDGLGNSTLTQKADIVYVHIGTNDIRYPVNLNTIKSNLLNMAQSCYNNSIIGIFSNIPHGSDYDSTKIANMQTINTWMNSTLPLYGITIINEELFSQDVNNPTKAKFEIYPDGVHPNKDGYRVLSQIIYESYVNRV